LKVYKGMVVVDDKVKKFLDNLRLGKTGERKIPIPRCPSPIPGMWWCRIEHYVSFVAKKSNDVVEGLRKDVEDEEKLKLLEKYVSDLRKIADLIEQDIKRLELYYVRKRYGL